MTPLDDLLLAFRQGTAEDLEDADPTLITVAWALRDIAAQIGGGVYVGGDDPTEAVEGGTWTWELLERLVNFVQSHMDAAWGDGAFGHHGIPGLRIAQNKEAHIDDLAGRLVAGWRLYTPEDRVRLTDRASANGRTREEEKHHLARLGLYEAHGDQDRPQTVRVGLKWITDDEGRQVAVTPSRINWITSEVYWLPNAAKAAALAALRDDPFPGVDALTIDLSDTLPLDDALLLSGPLRDPLSDLIHHERREEIRAFMDVAPLTDAERDLLVAYLDTGDWNDAGTALGLTSGQLYTRKSRLIAKLKDLDADRL